MRTNVRRNAAIANVIGPSLDVHVHNLLNDQPADHDHACGRPEHLDPDIPLPQHADHVWIDNIESNAQSDGQTGEHDPGDAALRGVGSDLALEPEPLPDHVSRLVQNFGKVAAALFLNHDGRGRDPEILQGNAVNQVVERGLELEPEVLFLEAGPELRANRILALAGHQAHGSDQAVSGPQRTDHQVESLGQLLLKRIESLLAFVEDEQNRKSRNSQSDEDGEEG